MAKKTRKKVIAKDALADTVGRKGPERTGKGVEPHLRQPTRHHDTPFTLLTDFDVDLFKAGRHFHLYNKLGCHLVTHQDVQGAFFAVWAPNARHVSVMGHFNGWNRYSHRLNVRWDSSGIWEGFVPHLRQGDLYKYFIESNNGEQLEKGDPYSFHWETPPATSTVAWDLDFTWTDGKWMEERRNRPTLAQPISIYEVHLGSWRKTGENRFLTYREIAAQLPDYCRQLGFTHVELMPVMEHPFFGSWGYQITGYFAPSSRFGTPQDFMYLVSELHRADIGVILDWVPSHFPGDAHGLYGFDGTRLYEHPDPRMGFHPDWSSYIFNYGRNEVRSFLVSNGLFWLDKYHIDGLRVDAVASMLYRDYSRKHGEWEPNIHGGRENLDAISFLQEFNDAVHTFHPDTITVAEESTAFPGVTHPPSSGGLGFDMKWMMGWMHDTLGYFQNDPIHRSHHQAQIAFSIVYAFSERFMLPLSHDEVVYGKGSLINKMPGDDWQQFANLRLLFSYMFGHPGAKMVFMGGEFGQRREWQHDYSLDWHETLSPAHHGLQLILQDLNRLYKEQPALYEHNFSWKGFEWIDLSDSTNSIISWTRMGNNPEDDLIFAANFTPMCRENYRIGTPRMGYYQEIFNSDDASYGGSDGGNKFDVETAPIPRHHRTHSLSLTLPPLGLIVLKKTEDY